MHLVIVQETVGRLLLGAAGEDRRQRLARMPLPGRPSRSNRFRKRPSARSERWNSRRAQLASSSTARAGNDPGARAGVRRSVCSQSASRPRSHTRFGSAAPADARRPPRGPAHARPARRLIARRGPRRLHARLHQHRPHPVARFPVRRQTPHRPAQHVRGQVRHPHPAAAAETGRWRPPAGCATRACGRPSPNAASRGPSRNGADTKLSTPSGPAAASSRYIRRQPGARARPSGWPASNRCAHSFRSASVSATRSRTSPNSAKLPQNSVSPSHSSPAPRPQPPRGGPGCAGGSVNPNCAARCGKALRAEAAHNAPRRLRHPSRSHSPRPSAARDSSPCCNSRRSHCTVSGLNMRSPTRTDPVLHGTPRLC